MSSEFFRVIHKYKLHKLETCTAYLYLGYHEKLKKYIVLLEDDENSKTIHSTEDYYDANRIFVKELIDLFMESVA